MFGSQQQVDRVPCDWIEAFPRHNRFEQLPIQPPFYMANNARQGRFAQGGPFSPIRHANDHRD
jgi:hypothetical protein